MADRFFALDYEERATLRDGTTVLLRLIRSSDKELLLRGFHALSEHSRFLRFLVPKSSLTDDELRYLTELDHEAHFAIGALRLDEAGEPQEGLGIARFIRYPDEREVAEAAIAVADEVHGRGLGTLLFMRLVAAASERGVRRFRCEVHATNNAMKELISGVNPEYSLEVRAGVMCIDFELPALLPAESPNQPPRTSSLYRFFEIAAKKRDEWMGMVIHLLKKLPPFDTQDPAPAPIDIQPKKVEGTDGDDDL